MEVWFRMQTALAFCLMACDISLHHTLHGRIEACNRISPTEIVNYIIFPPHIHCKIKLNALRCLCLWQPQIPVNIFPLKLIPLRFDIQFELNPKSRFRDFERLRGVFLLRNEVWLLGGTAW